jgi:ABC-type dipeptide/oligopeptide/nickel transport system permease subunit
MSTPMSVNVLGSAPPPGVAREFWSQFRLNRGALIGTTIILLFVVVALLAPLISPHDPAQIYNDAYSKAPFWSATGSTRFLLGTDDLGRDILSRLLYGARISIAVGFLVVLFSMTAGSTLGLLSGYRGGATDVAIMRVVDILMSLPSVLLAIVVVAVLGPGLFNAVIAVSIVAIPSFVRIVRGSVLAERTKSYVTAARSYGATGMRLAILDIFPNCLPPLIVQATLGFSDGILNVAALGFLGLGAQPPTAEWGTMLSDARAFIQSAPWMVTLPGLCILLVVLGFNLLGDGLRDALDPRLKK